MQRENYGNSHAELFDLMYGARAPTSMIDALERLAGGGPVLELGVGTGRVAVPLSERGVSVVGIDNSEAMLAKLAAKPGSHRVDARLGELPAIEVEGEFRLVLCLDQTLLLLPDQALQVECLVRSVARLAPGGKVVLETFASATPPHGGTLLTQANERVTVLWAAASDAQRQTFHIREIVFHDDAVTVIPFNGRGVSPAELDLMARIAGLKLAARWAGWDGSPPRGGEMNLISIYERP